MANEQLKQALRTAGIEIDQLASTVGVDVKTARRWLAGRTPYPKYRIRVADTLGISETILWPDAELLTTQPTDRDAGSDETDDLATFGAVETRGWTGMLATAEQQIDLLDYTLLEILNTEGVIDQLKQKAADGCQVRIMVADPNHETVQVAAREFGLSQGSWDDDPDDPDTPEIKLMLTDHVFAAHRLIARELIGQPGIEVRTFQAHRQNSILRFDQEMLVLIHTWGVQTPDALQLYTNADMQDGQFDRFAEHFDAIWENASTDFHPRLPRDEDPYNTIEIDYPLSEEDYQLELHEAQAFYQDAIQRLHDQRDAALQELRERRRAGQQRRSSKPDEPTG